MQPRSTPIHALAAGLVAGAVGSAAQSLFSRATKRIAPSSPPDAFQPPEPAQKDERPTETVARRLVEQMAQRGPLDDREKRRASQLVHYGFGAAWGGLFGLLRASYPRLWSVAGLVGFSAAVWILGDELLLPIFRVSTWPQRYPLRVHGYAAAAHLAYGAGVAAALVADDALSRRLGSRGCAR